MLEYRARMLRFLDRTVEIALGLLAVALIATAFSQVIARYVVSRPFSWVLELDVLLLVWATLLSGYLGVRRGLHMAVDVLIARWSVPQRRRADIASHLLCIGFAAILVWKSFEVIEAMEGIPFASLTVGQPWLYWSLPVGGALMLIALVDSLAWRLRAGLKPRER